MMIPSFAVLELPPTPDPQSETIEVVAHRILHRVATQQISVPRILSDELSTSCIIIRPLGDDDVDVARVHEEAPDLYVVTASPRDDLERLRANKIPGQLTDAGARILATGRDQGSQFLLVTGIDPTALLAIAHATLPPPKLSEAERSAASLARLTDTIRRLADRVADLEGQLASRATAAE